MLENVLPWLLAIYVEKRDIAQNKDTCLSNMFLDLGQLQPLGAS